MDNMKEIIISCLIGMGIFLGMVILGGCLGYILSCFPQIGFPFLLGGCLICFIVIVYKMRNN